jgi:hypothetical protein
MKRLLSFDSDNNIPLLSLPGVKGTTKVSLDKVKDFDFSVIEYKWINGKLWLRVQVWKKQCSDGYYSKEPRVGWVHPFSDKGKPLFTYGIC